MITNLKLSTVGWILVSLMVITGTAIIGGALIVNRNVLVINDIWNEFQTDRSEKARLESALRSAIGYGGMIHDFKNYILRQNESYRNHVESHIGAAHAILHQYNDLEITTAEAIAIDNIEHTIDGYLKALWLAEKLIKQKKNTILEIVKAVKVDDGPALSGLSTLRHEVSIRETTNYELSKGRIVADLRAAIGYGGMIHEFKDYVLNQDDAVITKITDKFKDANIAIARYRQYAMNSAEVNAIKEIEITLQAYTNNLITIQAFSEENISPLDIDSAVRVNDTPALHGLHTLDREINTIVAEDYRQVTRALQVVIQTIELSTWSTIVIIVMVIFISVWLFRLQIIRPIMRLTNSMTQLANNKIDIEIYSDDQENEMGQMTRAVMFFKMNMIKRRDAEQLVSSILNTVRDGIITVDSHGIIETFNPGAEEIFGYSAEEIIGKNISIVMPEPHRSAHDGYIKHFIEGKTSRDQSIPIEQIAVRKNGETFPAEITLNTMRIAGNIKITGLLRDITERKKWEEEIKLLAMTDPLTGLANRNEYNRRLEELAKQALRFNRQFALMQIDLDKFKPVNDTYGHPIGDALLQHVAKVLISSCRDVDIVARLGGDEFSIIVNGINQPDDVSILAKRISENLSVPVMIENHNIQISASMGISYYPNDSMEIEELIRMADEAMYLSKKEGRNTYRIYSNIHASGDPK